MDIEIGYRVFLPAAHVQRTRFIVCSVRSYQTERYEPEPTCFRVWLSPSSTQAAHRAGLRRPGLRGPWRASSASPQCRAFSYIPAIVDETLAVSRAHLNGVGPDHPGHLGERQLCHAKVSLSGSQFRSVALEQNRRNTKTRPSQRRAI